MLTRWFAFVPPCGLLSASGACSATTEAEHRNRPYIGRMAKNFRPFLDFLYWIYAFRSILYAFRSLHPKITENLPIN
jgi:hypothetical protein